VLATASGDGTARLWDVTTHQLITTLDSHSSVFRVAFSPDRRMLATRSLDGTAKLWNLATHQLLTTLPGHTNTVWGVAFSPDGHTLATASADDTVKLWDVATTSLWSPLAGHTNAVLGVTFSPDGRTLATGSINHTAKLWDVATHQLLATLTGHINNASTEWRSARMGAPWPPAAPTTPFGCGNWTQPGSPNGSATSSELPARQTGPGSSPICLTNPVVPEGRRDCLQTRSLLCRPIDLASRPRRPQIRCQSRASISSRSNERPEQISAPAKPSSTPR
jgi:WD40 domain-containing protein